MLILEIDDQGLGKDSQNLGIKSLENEDQNQEKGQNQEREGITIGQETETNEIERKDIKATGEADPDHGKTIEMIEDTMEVLIMIILKN